MPNAGWIESELTLFHDARNSLNTDEPNARDQPVTKLWPRLKMSLAKSPDATGSFRIGGSCRPVFWKLYRPKS